MHNHFRLHISDFFFKQINCIETMTWKLNPWKIKLNVGDTKIQNEDDENASFNINFKIDHIQHYWFRGLTFVSFQLYGGVLTMHSDHCRNAVVHTSNTPKSEIQVLWTAPPAGSGCVRFRLETIFFSFGFI